MTALTLCILQIEVYFGSPAPQAEPQDDAANAETFSRLLMIVTSLNCLLDFLTSLVYT